MPFSVFQLKQRDVSDTEGLYTNNKHWEHHASATGLGEEVAAMRVPQDAEGS